MHVLVIISGPRAGERVELAGDVVIGRENADVVIADEEMSRRHLALRPRDDAVEAEDLGSTNGSFVDGRRIDAPVLLDATTRLRIGETEIEVQVEPVRDPGATRVHAAPPADATVVGRAQRAPVAPAPAGDGAATSLPPFGELEPQRARARRGGVATRQALPALFTMAVIVAVAVALVVYFAAR